MEEIELKKTFFEMINGLNVIHQVNIMNRTEFTCFAREFSSITGQKIPEEIITEFYFSGLQNTDFFTSDFLTKKGFKNYHQWKASS